MKKVISLFLALIMVLTALPLTALDSFAITYAYRDGFSFATTVKNGWVTEDGNQYYYVSGEPLKGLQTIDGKQYVFYEYGGSLIKNMWSRFDGAWYNSGPTGEVINGPINTESIVTSFEIIKKPTIVFSKDGPNVFECTYYNISNDGVFRVHFYDGTFYDIKNYIAWSLSGGDNGETMEESFRFYTKDYCDDSCQYLFDLKPSDDIHKNSETYSKSGLYESNSLFFILETNSKGFLKNEIELQLLGAIYDGSRISVLEKPTIKLKWDRHGWETICGKKYYFGSDSKAYKSKLASLDGKKYYFGSDGAMYTKRLISVSGKKYYMGSDGAAVTSKLISVNGKKYYMGKDGVAYKSKLISVDGKKYYIGSDCVAYKSKFASLDGKKYYFGSDCVMVKSKLISVDGKKYYMGKDGVMYKSKLISVDSKKYYIGSDGVAYKSRLASVDGKKYYFGSDCVAYKSKFGSIDGKKYYFGSDCVAYKSKFASVSGKKYYFGSDCVMYKSKTFSVSGVKWKADKNGVCKKV